jgi:hypothetical protein
VILRLLSSSDESSLVWRIEIRVGGTAPLQPELRDDLFNDRIHGSIDLNRHRIVRLF